MGNCRDRKGNECVPSVYSSAGAMMHTMQLLHCLKWLSCSTGRNSPSEKLLILDFMF